MSKRITPNGPNRCRAAFVGALCFAQVISIATAPEALAQESTGGACLLASPEPGWAQWRGPRRDGVCDETGLLQQWPEGGPRLLWQTNGLGRGYSAPIITGGRIYSAGDVEDDLLIFALDSQGKQIWKATNGQAWKGAYPGARASCTFSEGRLYHLNAHGRVAGLDAATGKEVWAVDMRERFGSKVTTWAYSENLLVDGPRVIVTPGGPKAMMAALDKKTGTTVWTSEPLRFGESKDPAHERLLEPARETDNAGHSSPILFTLGGRRHLVNSSQRHFFGADADTGQLLWTRPMPTPYLVIAVTPVLVGDAVYMTAPDAKFRGLYRLSSQVSGVSVERLWTGALDTCHGGLVLVDGMLTGSFYRGKSWASLDARTGETQGQIKNLAKGAVLWADGRFYCLSEEGEMALLKSTSQGLEVVSRFRLVSGRKSDVWTHPVILDGRLYLRFHETLFCYDIRGR